MIKLVNVSKEYVISNDNKIKALSCINLELPETGFIAIVGKSGSGKTTLLNLIGGVDVPTFGKLEIDGKELKYTNHKLDLYRNYEVSFVFQDYNLLEDYNVIDNVKLGIEVQGIKKHISDKRALNALKSVGLKGYGERRVSNLSGGQRQRVAIARALCKESRYVLCDEPTGNLDSTTSNEVFALIKSLSKNRAFIMVTHDEDSALMYADRIITISDGEILSDKLNTTSTSLNSKVLLTDINETFTSNDEKKRLENEKTLQNADIFSEKKKNDVPQNEHKYNENNESIAKKSYGLGVRHCLQMIKHNIRHSLFSSFIVFLLLVVSFTLVSSFISLSLYDEKDAYLNTLKANDQYVLSISKYVDKVITYENGYWTYGYEVDAYSVNEEDVTTLQNDMPEGVSIYPSYYFVKPLSDFGDIDLTIYSYTGYSYAFKEAIVVSDFDNFNSPLIYGDYPSQYNDILIYDYMAYSLIEQGLFNTDVSNLVGETLSDKVNGLELRICGIIESNFIDYLNLTYDSYSYDFAIAYLSTLNAIFCGPDLLEEIQTKNDSFSIYNSYYFDNNDEKEISISKFAGQYLKSLDDLTIYAKSDSFYTDEGLIISKNTLASILGISLTEISEQIAINFMNSYNVMIDLFYDDPEIGPIVSSSFAYEVLAITEENFDNDNILYLYSNSDYELIENENGIFRQLYVGLSSDWNINKTVIDYFWYKDAQSLSFYEENPDYYDEVFSIYDPVGFLITDVNYFLVNVQSFAETISYILLGLTVIVVLTYTFILLKKFDYKIGVLKAIGAKTSNVITIFGAQLILISLGAFIVHIPLTFLLLSLINGIFIEGINTSLVFFTFKLTSALVTLGIAVFGVAIIAGIPLLKLALTSPVKTILASRKR